MDYRHGLHTIFSIHIHIVWITKYCKKVLKNKIATFVRDVIHDKCNRIKIDFINGYVSKDYVYLLIFIPVQVTISRLI